MKDRVSQNPGRVLITPEDGSTPFYATMTRADNPTVEGTKLNKNALLKDATAALFGLGTDAVPDDIYLAVKAALDEFGTELAAGPKVAVGSYSGTGSTSRQVTFPFAPKYVVISVGSVFTGNTAGVIAFGYGQTRAVLALTSNASSETLDLSWSGNGVTMSYSGSYSVAWHNYSGVNYYYLVIG